MRQYSNYLTPKIGLSTDALAAISVWFTNTLLNQIVLISFLMAISASVFLLNQCLLGLHDVNNWVGYASLGIMLLAGFLVLQESTQTPKKQSKQSHWQIILAVGMVGAILFALWLAESWQSDLNAWWHFCFDLPISPYWLILPTIVLVISILIVAGIGFAGRQINKHLQITSFMREWWARLGGVTLFMSLLWLAVFVCILYLPLKLDAWLKTSPVSSFSVIGL